MDKKINICLTSICTVIIKTAIYKYMTNHTVTDTAVTCNNKISDKKNNVTYRFLYNSIHAKHTHSQNT